MTPSPLVELPVKGGVFVAPGLVPEVASFVDFSVIVMVVVPSFSQFPVVAGCSTLHSVVVPLGEHVVSLRVDAGILAVSPD